ncbi:MAG: aminoglycoside phosphotransferase family protein [Pseudomarimonas sp.]
MNVARADVRLSFARNALNLPTLELVSASSDASFRSYWRTVGATPERIVMDAPPDREDLGPWLNVAQRLQSAGLNAPSVLAQDLANGFLLISDLGNALLLPALNATSVDHHYSEATRAVLAMQTAIDAADLPAYDEPRLVTEMELLPTWFLQRHLGMDIACEQWDVIELAFRTLVINAQAQPQRFVHRDFHSRNLMLSEHGLGIIDFQDAVRGPLTYDLVSLLRDCYIEWPQAQVENWVETYRQQANKAGLTDADRARFLRWFDLMGLQRHIKVLGIFCRLWYRDGKAGYLADLPLVWRYTREVGRRYPEISPLIQLIESAIGQRDITQPA